MNKYILDNSFWIFLIILVIACFIPLYIFLIKKFGLKIESKNLSISNYKDDRRDNTEYLYHIEKIKDSYQQIIKLHDQLELKQVDIYATSFEKIEHEIMYNYKIKLLEYCERKNIKIDANNIEHTNPYVIYQRLIHSITKENFRNITNYVKDNELWKYTPEEWEKYKKKNREKYMDASREKFTLLYSDKYCIMPFLWHNLNVMVPTEKKIKEIIGKMQEESREMSKKYHKLERCEMTIIENIEKIYERNENDI